MPGELTRERITIHGPRGRLAGELAYDDTAAMAALIANPHPHMGGEMRNNVVTTLAGELPAHGCLTLRFDYAGVGNSDGGSPDVAASMAAFWQTGHAPDDPSLVEDLQAAREWLTRETAMPVALIGYSFGAYAAAQCVTAVTPALVMISPTVTKHDFGALNLADVPMLVLYSDNDFATPRDATEAWLHACSPNVQSHCISGGEHFYRGCEADIAQRTAAFLADASHARRAS